MKALQDYQRQAVQEAAARIAPTWPLDKLIAVNPLWELRNRPFAEVSAHMAALAKVNCLMPKDYYAELWLSDIRPIHLQQAAHLLGESTTIDALLEYLQIPDSLSQWHNVSDWIDSHGERQQRMAWRDEITHQISQFCASFFQSGSPFRNAETPDQGLYCAWLKVACQDRGLDILMAEPTLSAQFRALPEDHEALLTLAIKELALEQEKLADYLHALLLDINGWSSWIAYLRWQARLNGTANHELMAELLAVRLGWELVLWRHYGKEHKSEFFLLQTQWQTQWSRLPEIIVEHLQAQKLALVWQRAAELAYQEALHNKLSLPVREISSKKPSLQAVFCIDVRSEPMRRALEAQDSTIETRGFAGFFGLPLEYLPAGTALARPQLPGLIKPVIQVSECSDVNGAQQQRQISKKLRWQALNDASPATFSLVEAVGLGYGLKLLKNSFKPAPHAHPVNGMIRTGKWVLSRNQTPLSVAEKIDLVAVILGAMGLTKNFAPWVLLVGHGSQSRNNPHAAGLDCGACGGQTGELNVRVLASLLNDREIRCGLAEQGIAISDQTRFVAALHNTTTDDISCFDPVEDDSVNTWLAAASDYARGERACKLGFKETKNSTRLASLFHKRSQDWSQVRPEWGLANNASFIVAPRDSVKHLDLEGRSFLHDYQWQQDQDFRVLELIITAPLVVTHWINMQYNASVTDNHKFGSGNKVLHNIVGGNLGVFEGNGGDLRFGLPVQSVHNGHQWMHQPLRLSVYLAAPQAKIAEIISRHQDIAHLVDNDWLYVYQWETENRKLYQYYRSEWHEVAKHSL